MKVVNVYLIDIEQFKKDHKIKDGLGVTGYRSGYIVESDNTYEGEDYICTEYVDHLSILESPILCYLEESDIELRVASVENTIQISDMFIEKYIDIKFDGFDWNEGVISFKDDGELDNNTKAYFEMLEDSYGTCSSDIEK